MLSSEGQPTDTGITGELVSSDTQIQWDKELDYGKIFQLIESFLSFEACLYHQMLPLRFENKSLILGMVNLDDEAALDYVSRILSYVHCTMVKVAMTADNHRSILSAYLNYKNTSEPSGGQLSPPESNPSPQQTDDSSLAQPQVESSVNTTPSDSSPITQLHKEMEESGIDTGLITTKPPILILPKPEELIPVELLTTLPPKKFLEELLGRVIVGGIGRLYFERLPYEGKILWSENGVLQSVLEKLPLSVFQGALNELKKFAKLSISTLSEPKQVEKEYIYQEQRLLLRLRVMPGMYGEEATLQVLKGAALKFYQQQQLSRISRDALTISQQLSGKLHELQDRMLQSRNISTDQIETLAVLNRLLNNLDSQIKNLTSSEENSK